LHVHHKPQGDGDVRRTWPIRYRPFPSSKCIFFCFLSNKREERDYLLSLFVLLYVELVSFGTPRQEHTWNRFIRKNGTRVIFYFWYFLSYWMISSIPRIPRTQMKSLHFWFLVVTYFHIRLMERIEKCNYTNSHFYLFCQEHTWNRFIRKNGTRVIFYFTYFHRWTHMK